MKSGSEPGRQTEPYQRMLGNLIEQSRAAEDLGYQSITFTEHHFETEGLEVSPNPPQQAQLVGLRTNKIRVGTMGVQLPSWNPIRLAEEIATLDQILEGRLDIGIVRGNQNREVPNTGQRWGVRPADRASEEDKANWRVHVEHFNIVRTLLDHPGNSVKIKTEHWEIPVAGNLQGDAQYMEWSSGWGGIGRAAETNSVEIGKNENSGSADNIGYRTLLWEGRSMREQLEVGICPKPYQTPFPAFYVPFTTTPETISWAAREAMPVVLFEGGTVRFNSMRKMYEDAAAGAGHNLRPGQRVNAVAWFCVSEDEDEVRRVSEPTQMWFRIARTPALTHFLGEETPQPLTWERFIHPEGEGLFVGTPDQIVHKLGNFIEETHVDELFLLTGLDMIPHSSMMKSMELFATRVMPQLGGMHTEFGPEKVAVAAGR
jgi:alkanesulfonate monooxygenase SsuD/methylene tetrahydromethanopterin reductase-like flavin-dependent oxidoreductase (luciferase family)